MAKSNLKERASEIEELVVKAQNGHHDAFSELYDIFVDPIYRYIFYKVNREDVEDLTETVFLKVWEHLKKYKHGKHSFSAWIFRIAHNLVIDHYRKSRPVDELDFDVTDHKREHNPIKTTGDKIDQEILGRALKKVKPQYQEIVIYKFINEFSNKEIAQILNKSEGGVRILQFRALKALKRELNEMGITKGL